MTTFRQAAVESAREAGAFLKERLHADHRIDFKGEINLVTEADRTSEEIITSRIQKLFPDHDVMAEESTNITRGAEYRWIIDPLDGTTNYAHGYPLFCVSIALQRMGEVILGVIYDPMFDELFVAERGEGAFLQGREIHVSTTERLIEGLVATGFPYDVRENCRDTLAYFNEMIPKVQAIRRIGSAALDLAYVAVGRFDGFWELRLQPWDTAAGWLMVEEAGGVVTDLNGKPYSLESPSIVASNAMIHEELMDVLDQASSMI
ncbi:MAG: inositol monophosphatase [Deltaproteobacteria bacterium]|nr:MAG: inositol monophosphatase [Deltaproteobacteria bacterium]